MRELEWIVLRRDGESAALIAHRFGVGVGVVERATRAYGPFPRPSQQLGRRVMSAEQVRERQSRWVAERRRGVPVVALATAEGVSHQVVSKVTAGFGPFPAAEVIAQWVAGRRDRVPVRDLVERYGVPAAVIRRHTRAAGPFPLTGPRVTEAVETVESIARRVKLSAPTVLRWQKQGYLPEPDFVTARGRSVWLPGTIDCWIEEVGLEVCPECGARARSVSRHRTQAHHRARPSNKPASGRPGRGDEARDEQVERHRL